MPVPGNETTSYCLADLNLNFTVDAMLLPRRYPNRSSSNFSPLFFSLTERQAGGPETRRCCSGGELRVFLVVYLFSCSLSCRQLCAAMVQGWSNNGEGMGGRGWDRSDRVWALVERG